MFKFVGLNNIHISVILLTWFTPYITLILIYVSDLMLLLMSHFQNVKTVIRFKHLYTIQFLNNICNIFFRHVSKMWTRYLKFWHNHTIVGMENIPKTGPGKANKSQTSEAPSLVKGFY